jgi:predicted dehydrogenase
MEADAFVAAVRGQAEPFVTPEQSLARMDLLDELRRQIGLSF